MLVCIQRALLRLSEATHEVVARVARNTRDIRTWDISTCGKSKKSIKRKILSLWMVIFWIVSSDSEGKRRFFPRRFFFLFLSVFFQSHSHHICVCGRYHVHVYSTAEDPWHEFRSTSNIFLPRLIVRCLIDLENENIYRFFKNFTEIESACERVPLISQA